MMRRSARASKKSTAKKRKEEEDSEADATDPMEVDDDDDDEESSSASEEEEVAPRRGRRPAPPASNKSRSRPSAAAAAAAPEDDANSNRRRSSSRTTKFQKSMKEPSGDSVRDLFVGAAVKPHYDSDSSNDDGNASVAAGSSRRGNNKSRSSGDDDDDDDEQPLSISLAKQRQQQQNKRQQKSPATKQKKNKSPARRHSQARKSIPHEEDDDDDEEHSLSSEEEEPQIELEDEEEEDMKIQRILASRTETKRQWREIGKSMNTSEVTDGSRWFQEYLPEEDNIIEERFLVKWANLSYLHVSWETQQDLMDQIEGAKTYLSTFFRKSQNGVLLSADERKDGDYFDPGFVQIDRILELSSEAPGDPKTWEEEQTKSMEDFGIVLDKSDKNFEDGTGRQMLIKWESVNYSDCTYEFERDLLLAELDYKPALQDYYERTHKPTKQELQSAKSLADTALRRSYKLFGDTTDMAEEAQQAQVTEYQQKLADHVFRNGGQLRDYQAEGVTWFLANYVNKRSCIMADEMGLGKTLQTAAFCNLLVQRMHKRGPFLVVVPLSTMAHWQREFVGWTGLNTIVYHGSADDRAQIRQVEFAFPQDRPSQSAAAMGSNALYLNKCAGHTRSKQKGGGSSSMGGPWMATVVVTTPEMLVADDWAELAAVRWEVLVVDEAHRLKNHNSKLAVNLRKDQFHFQHKILLTGTPIQNDVKEFWTLLNFIDPKKFDSQQDFLDKYGEIKSKDRIDELHDTIRPYILRRLKEDVEKSVPPKEETLIEVELTVLQKQYYRALYEKNVKFLHKNKKKALDGPSLNNLAMQLRKCCNHLFLLNGVEEEIRNQQSKNGVLSETDFLSQGSGKFVLLDKLLPRLKQDGHRILLFSQFKIMLDILEDYLTTRSMKFERIDGSITGPKRQQAIDRFQDPSSSNPPFIMLLSTRAGGVGINLTSADTCIIFDSDWNPQNDLQAQARCHRIGQTKSVKVYRLLSRKTYEMQMFHMSSLKMGLDQAVLKGFENNGSSGEAAMTKEEVEKLLRHGAYDIFNEDKAGKAEAESKDFVEQDIDSILARRSRTVIHDNTGSQSGAAGGTFSKASFVAKTPTGKKGSATDDIDIEDPEFWTKMVGEAKEEVLSELKPRKRSRMNYSEKSYANQFNQVLDVSDSDGSNNSDESDTSDDEDYGEQVERARWGGQKPGNWKRSQAKDVLEGIERHGYGGLPWDQFMKKLPESCKDFSEEAVRRMAWSFALLGISEVAKEEASMSMKRVARNAEKKRESEGGEEGGVLAESAPAPLSSERQTEILEATFKKIWNFNVGWAEQALVDAVAYAKSNEPRSLKSLGEKADKEDECKKLFYQSVWPSLKGRGWKEEDTETGKSFQYNDLKFDSPSAVLNEVVRIHPELANMVIPILNTLEELRLAENQQDEQNREKDLQLNAQSIDMRTLNDFLQRYAPLQILTDRKSSSRIAIGRRVLSCCYYSHVASDLVRKAESADSNQQTIERLENLLVIEPRATLPHPLWTSKHDATLILAIAKHGWVDRDKFCRAMIEDTEIEWGHPFQKAEPTVVKPLSPSELRNLQSTANRAADFLENRSDLVEALTGCNRHLIIESYGLKENPSETKTDENQWVVDDDLLRQGSTKNGDESDASDLVDLPAKKDLVKRAKTVLRRTLSYREAGAEGNGGKKPDPSNTVGQTKYGYTVIDQGDRCCILLAEMIRGIVRGSSTKRANELNLMFAIAHEEASALHKMYSSDESTASKAEEMQKVVRNIATAKKSLKLAAVPSKNILRVMLGLEPLPLRTGNSATDSLFPETKTLENTPSKESSKKDFRRDDGALGEKAIARALKKAFDKCLASDGSPCLFSKEDDPDQGLQLTMIEIMILVTCCSEGVPMSAFETANASSGVPSTMSWEKMAAILEVTVKDSLQTSTDKLTKCRAALTKLEENGDQKAKTQAAKRVAVAESEEAMKEEAAQLAVDYAANTAKLAKKSIMLLEKLRKYGFSGYSFPAKYFNKVENGLGTKVTTWFGKELSKLANEFDVADSLGGAMCFTTEDMVDQNDDDNSAATVAAYMDKKSSRQVVSQIAVVARIRELFAKHSDEDLRDQVGKAVSSSRKHEDSWEKRPAWWDDSSDHNYLLLKKLGEHGYSNFSAHTDGFGPVGEGNSGRKSFKELGLTRSIVQQRANQLMREIHQAEEQKETMKLLQDRRNRAASKTNGLDSLADINKPKSKRSKTVQTGLRAFFASTKTNSKKENVVVLSDNEEVASDGSKSTGKRKTIEESDEDSPAEKKPRNEDGPIRVIPGKFGECDTDPSSPKRSAIRTLVNSQGKIEVVNVPDC